MGWSRTQGPTRACSVPRLGAGWARPGRGPGGRARAACTARSLPPAASCSAQGCGGRVRLPARPPGPPMLEPGPRA